MKQKSENIYYEGFVKCMSHACDAAKCLMDIISDFNPATLAARVDEIHAIEHAADTEKHALMQLLAKEFITPIEREDIMQLVQQIDDVTDDIEDVVRKLYMYNVTNIRAETREFAEIILRCCVAARDALSEMPNFRKSEKLLTTIIRVNELEEMGDRLHFTAMRRLYTEDTAALERIQWTEMFDWLENCCDNVEHVTDTIEMVVMKNS